MKVYLKNMVCQGTRKFVLMELKKLELKLKSFESGRIEFTQNLTNDEVSQLEMRLGKYGLEMIVDRDNMTAVVPAYQGTDHIRDYEYLLESAEVDQFAEAMLVE